jgi:hypothetical protein
MSARPQEPDLYGIIEIAMAIHEDRRKVAVWHGRGKLPPANFRVSAHPIWKPDTIRPWIVAYRIARRVRWAVTDLSQKAERAAEDAADLRRHAEHGYEADGRLRAAQQLPAAQQLAADLAVAADLVRHLAVEADHDLAVAAGLPETRPVDVDETTTAPVRPGDAIAYAAADRLEARRSDPEFAPIDLEEDDLVSDNAGDEIDVYDLELAAEALRQGVAYFADARRWSDRAPWDVEMHDLTPEG